MSSALKHPFSLIILSRVRLERILSASMCCKRTSPVVRERTNSGGVDLPDIQVSSQWRPIASRVIDRQNSLNHFACRSVSHAATQPRYAVSAKCRKPNLRVQGSLISVLVSFRLSSRCGHCVCQGTCTPQFQGTIPVNRLAHNVTADSSGLADSNNSLGA